jgi:hypothetical protein
VPVGCVNSVSARARVRGPTRLARAAGRIRRTESARCKTRQRGIPQDAAGSSRRRSAIPASYKTSCLRGESPLIPGPTRKHQDRPVTPEVAGSSPVASVEHSLQIDIFCCRAWRNRPPAFQPVKRLSRTRIPDEVRSSKALQMAIFSGRAPGQSRRSSRADPASEWPICLEWPLGSLELTVRVTGWP